MKPEVKAPWDEVERRKSQLPTGLTALEIAHRIARKEKAAVGTEDLRKGDLANPELKERIGEILEIATRDLPQPIPAYSASPAKPSETAKRELTPEETYFRRFKTRFDSLPQLHVGIEWAYVEKSLKADPEQSRKLQSLDEKGHNMNVFGEEKGEFIFVSGWTNYNDVSIDHKNICYDREGKELAERKGRNLTGNAVDIAASMGADVADPGFHEQLIRATVVNGWAWLKTNADMRKTGDALGGNYEGVDSDLAYRHDVGTSFRAEIRCKKT